MPEYIYEMGKATPVAVIYEDGTTIAQEPGVSDEEFERYRKKLLADLRVNASGPRRYSIRIPTRSSGPR